MNDNEPKSKLSSLKKIIGIYPCILLIVFGVLYYLERPSSNIIKPKLYRDVRLSIPGVAEYDQRKRIVGIIKSLELSGIVSTTSSNAAPPEYSFQDVGKDIWGTSLRCEMTNNLLSIRSAGPDKKYYTSDDLVYRN